MFCNTAKSLLQPEGYLDFDARLLHYCRGFAWTWILKNHFTAALLAYLPFPLRTSYKNGEQRKEKWKTESKNLAPSYKLHSHSGRRVFLASSPISPVLRSRWSSHGSNRPVKSARNSVRQYTVIMSLSGVSYLGGRLAIATLRCKFLARELDVIRF